MTSIEAQAAIPVPEQLPLALVYGEAVTEMPQDLYIPPDALEVFLEAFEGPLDLLLYLIRKQNIDILDIPVAEITRQYMGYVELMKVARLELAAEYLVMAAMLAEIKSRMLLPRSSEEDEDEEDPRAELIRRLQEYERFKPPPRTSTSCRAWPRVCMYRVWKRRRRGRACCCRRSSCPSCCWPWPRCCVAPICSKATR